MQKLDLKKPKADIFDRLKYDLFDRLKYDLFERVELPTEEKVAYSSVMKEVLREEFQKLIASLPIPGMISKAMEKMAARQMKSESGTRETLEKTIEKIRGQFSREIEALKINRDAALEKLRKRYDDLKSESLSPKYQFGGFSPTQYKLSSGVITRAGNFISSVSVQGRRTITLTRDANNYITSSSDGNNTWTFTRNASNQITSWTVS